MSKTNFNGIDKKNFYKFKPVQQKITDTMKFQVNNKQNLRDLIMDYTIKNLFNQNHKNKSSKYQKGNCFSTTLKKIPFYLDVQINSIPRKIQINGYTVLQKYIEYEQKNIYKQQNIQPLVIEILNFFDEMSQIAENINFEFPQESSNIQMLVISILLEKYHKDKQKISRIRELDTVKSKTIAKYTRVSYIDIENKMEKKQCQVYVEKSMQNSHRVSRDTISSTVTDKDSTQVKDKKSKKSKLADLVQKYKVFQHPQKIQQLRKQKLQQIYQEIEVQKISQMQKSSNNIKRQSTSPKQKIQTYKTGNQGEIIQFLQNWIVDINISQKLFKLKAEIKQKKNKQSQIAVGKIIQESQDDEEKQTEHQINFVRNFQHHQSKVL